MINGTFTVYHNEDDGVFYEDNLLKQIKRLILESIPDYYYGKAEQLFKQFFAQLIIRKDDFNEVVCRIPYDEKGNCIYLFSPILELDNSEKEKGVDMKLSMYTFDGIDTTDYISEDSILYGYIDVFWDTSPEINSKFERSIIFTNSNYIVKDYFTKKGWRLDKNFR